MLKRLFLFIIFLHFILFSSRAAGGGMRFHNYDVSDGLSSNHVNAVIKDRDGYIWLGTSSGLDRFDGYRVVRFQSSASDTTALHDNFVRQLSQDSSGNIYVRAGDEYSVYNPATGLFHRISSADLAAWGTDSRPARMVASGDLLYIAPQKGGMIWRDKDGKFSPIADPSGLLAERCVTSIYPSPERNVLAAVNTEGRLFLADIHQGKVIRTVDPPGPHADTLEDVGVFLDNEGLAWIYSVKGVYIYDTMTRRWRDDLRGLLSYPDYTVSVVRQDSQGRIWIGYDKTGLEVIDKSGSSETYVNDPSDPFSLGNNSVRDIYFDDMDGAWVSTFKRGVAYYNKCEYMFGMTRASDVNCISVRDRSSVWFGTDSEGLGIYDLESGKVSRIPAPELNPESSIVCLLPDDSDALWIGTYKSGLMRYADGKFGHYGHAHGLADDNVWALADAPDGMIYVGMLNGGLQLFSPSAGVVKTWNHLNSGLTTDVITSLRALPDGNLLIGTAYGVFRLDVASDVITEFLTGNTSDKNRLSNLNINQLYIDSRNLLWIATPSGLEMYDMREDRLYNVPLSGSPEYTFVRGVIEDNNGSMWVTVDNLLFNVSLERSADEGYSFRSVAYDERNGLYVGNFNQRSFCRTEGGEILVGGLFGIAHIIPDEIYYNKYPPEVHITGLSTGVQNENIFNTRGDIRLPYSSANITISFATDNFIHPEKTVYFYRLKGQSDEWIELPEGSGSLSFSSLPPGDYILEVRAVNNDGVESAAPAVMAFSVAPPFWRSWWAVLIYLALTAGAVYAISLLIKRNERRKYVEKRKQEEAEHHEELNQLKFKFFTNISHELRTPLTLILSPVDSMLKENPQGRNLARLNTIQSNARRLLYLVNQLLDFRKNEMVGLTFRPAKSDVTSTLRKAFDDFVQQAEQRGISYEFHAPEVYIMDFDADKLSKAVINLLSNAFKFTPDGGAITLSVRENAAASMLDISVADTGSGISEKDRQHIFERFFSASASSSATGTGIGLSMVQEYTKLHNGTVSLEDNKPRGSIFTISIPVVRSVRPDDTGTPAPDEPAETVVADEVAEIPADEAPDAPPEEDKLRVLLVDDNTDLLHFLSGELADEFAVVTARSGDEALEVLSSDKDFSLIVSDIMMPGIDGIELCRRIKSDPATAAIPLMLLTAKEDVGSVVEGLTLGADDYVTKPFDNDILRLRMRKLARLAIAGMRRGLIEPQVTQIEITSLDRKLVDNAVRYVEENMSRCNLSVEELSTELGMSRVHLYKKLLSLTGKPPTEFIRILRLKRACQYLRESQLTVAEIAYKVGFNNPKYFSKYFRDEYGVSPSLFQEREGISESLEGVVNK